MTLRGVGYRVPRWALPGDLAAFDGGSTGRRTVRDWLVDSALFLVAVWWWVQGYLDFVNGNDPVYDALVPGWMMAVDPWVGAVACLSLWWRRRYPLALAIASVPALSVASTSTGVALIAIFTLAVHRGWLPATLVTAVQSAQALVFASMWHPPEMTRTAFIVFMALMFVAPLGWGMVVRFRRQLLLSLRRDAARERDEHGRRLADARRAERERIAREMHDVLAHRISLLSVHAGALAYRTEQAGAGAGKALASEEVTEAVRVIRDNAHQALTELGEVLSVLRADEPPQTAPRQAPPPLLTDLPRLVDEARAAGQQVDFALEETAPGSPPLRPQDQRTIYRVVQEGLTNARKHAPRSPVSIRVSSDPDAGVRVTVRNPLPVGLSGSRIPGAGAGLTGLAERVALDGGTLTHGPEDGTFQLAARLPGPR